jgi:isoleucyl-tRNA synthetase
MVLSTLLFDKPPWHNIIVNGLVLAADGKKMSKRLQNYPDPATMCDRYGADAVRMYMCSSPVVRAEPLRFKEEGLRDVVKDVFLPWYNAYRFLVIEATRFELGGSRFAPDSGRVNTSPNLMDGWINASLHNLIRFVREEMIPGYRLYTVMGGLTNMLEDLTNWYVRLNRDRMRGQGGPDEALTSLCTLFEVLLNVSVLLAPVTPFLSEHMYQNLARALPDGHAMKAASVHFVMVPEHDARALDPAIQTAVSRMRSVVELGRGCREQRKIGLKTPLKSMTVHNRDRAFLEDLRGLQQYLEQELGVLDVVYSEEFGKFELVPSLNFPLLGKRLGKQMRAVQEAVKRLSQHELAEFETSGSVTVCGVSLNAEELLLTRRIPHGLEDSNLHANWDSSTVVVMDFTPDDDLRRMATSRDVANKVQKLRKEAGLQPGAAVDIWAQVVQSRNDSQLRDVLDKKEEYINKLLRWRLQSHSTWDPRAEILNQGVFRIDDEELRVTITRRMVLDPPDG